MQSKSKGSTSSRKKKTGGIKNSSRASKRPSQAKSTRGEGAKTAKTRTPSSASATGRTSASSRTRKRGSGKRDLVKTPTGEFFARRDGNGEFREMDEVGRSLAADRRTKAKTKVASGYGDRGDR